LATTNKNFKVKNGLDVGGNTVITGDANVTGKLSVTASAGDEGGEIFLSNAVTNTTITNGVTIDIYKDRLRFFEQGGDARGFYVDITTGGSAASTNLVGGGGGTASNSFATVSANGTSVVADSSTDTLTITPGSGMSIVGNATSDTVTFSVDYAEKIYYLVRNNTGSTIPKGTLVSASGAEASGRIDVAPHSTTGTQDSELRVMGMATANISNGVNGEVISFGTLVGIDTRGDTASAIAVGDETWAEGDILYAHPTVAGKLTKVRPQHDLAVAFITVRHASTGQIAVRIIPGNHHLEWLHDVAIDGTPADNELLAYNSASSLWINQTAEEAGVANLSGATFTGNVAGTNANLSGNVNATTFFGSGSGLTSLPSIVTDDTKPSSPVDGQVWFNASTGKTYVYYVDADSGQWVEIFGSKDIEDLKARTSTAESDIASIESDIDAFPKSPNYLINGGFDFWQRGTSFTADGYCADRWYFNETGVCTVTQATTDLPAGFNYALEATATTSSDSVDLHQALESSVVIPLRGKTVTFSCYLKMDSDMRSQGSTFRLTADYSTSTDARVSQTTSIGDVVIDKSLYADWARASYTFTVPINAVGLMVGIEPPTTSSPTTSKYFVTGAMLEISSTPTEFRRAGSTYTQEQAACYRYYYRLTNPSAATFPIASGAYYTTTVCYVPFRMPVTMRVAPTLGTSTASNFLILAGGSSRAASGIAQYGTTNTDVVTMSVTTSVGTAGQGAWMETATNAAFLEFSAEL
jgi:hypothetical protein